MTITIKRFLSARRFLESLRPLHAFGFSSVDEKLLEELERHGLLMPRFRLKYPDAVARRLWLENGHEELKMNGPTEPDTDRWQAAASLNEALFRWYNPSVYPVDQHPFDTLDNRYSEFVSKPSVGAFVPWDELRVDVSNDKYPVLFDSTCFESFYAPWQVLQAAEVAEIGFFFRLNLEKDDIFERAVNQFNQGKRPSDTVVFNTQGISTIRAFEKHKNALDGLVLATEQSDRALLRILGPRSGRIRMTDQQSLQFSQVQNQSTQDAIVIFTLDLEQMKSLLRFLTKQWTVWNRVGRAHIADAYKMFGAMTIRFIQLAFKVPLDSLRSEFGVVLDQMWPDWATNERERLSLTLKYAFGNERPQDADLAAFTTFIESKVSDP